MKTRILILCLLSILMPARAALITATITVTNTAGIGTNWIVNGNTRTWTNAAGTPPASWITTGANVGATATNLYNHIIRYPYSVPQLTPAFSSTNVITLRGNAITITTNNYFSVSYSTNTGTNLTVVQVPFENVPGETNRTNNAHWLVDAFNRYVRTNAFATNATVVSNLLVTGASPQQYVAGPVQFNGVLRAGAAIALTNGFTKSVTNIDFVSSNGINFGSAFRSEGSGGNSFQVGSNAQAKGNLSLAIGNNALASNDNAVAVGIGAVATNASAVALGTGTYAGGDSATALGKGAAAMLTSGTTVGESSVAGFQGTAIGATASAIGGNATAAGYNAQATAYYSTAVGNDAAASAIYAGAFGTGAQSTHSNSTAVGQPDHAGNAVATTDTNQIRLGVASTRISALGLYESPASTNAQFAGTNVWRGDVNYPWFALSSLANGNNISVPLGTNRYVRLSGTLTADGTICGAIAGATSGGRDGQPVTLWNDTGQNVIITEDTVDPIPANRFDLFGGYAVTMLPDSMVDIVYAPTIARWKVASQFPASTNLIATATNAIASATGGKGTNTQIYTSLQVFGNQTNDSRFVIDDTSPGSGGRLWLWDGAAAALTPFAYIDDNILTMGGSSGGYIDTVYFDASSGASRLAWGADNSLKVMTLGGSVGAPNYVWTNGYFQRLTVNTNLAAKTITVSNDLTLLNATASRVAVFNSSQQLTNSAAVSTTELEFLDGVTSALQTQLDGKVDENTGVATNLAVWGGLGIGVAAVADVQNPPLVLAGTNSSGQSVIFKIVETNALLRFDASVNGAAYGTLATLTTAGTLTIQGALSAANNFVTVGTTLFTPSVDCRKSNVVDTITLTNNLGIVVGSVGGVGGANTNFTLQAIAAAGSTNGIYYVNAGTTNVNIVAIMGGSESVVYRGTVILTNRTATARTLSLGATTNNWISLQKYDGITAPFTVTNSLAGRLDYEVKGSNVFYSYKPCDLPSN